MEVGRRALSNASRGAGESDLHTETHDAEPVEDVARDASLGVTNGVTPEPEGPPRARTPVSSLGRNTALLGAANLAVQITIVARSLIIPKILTPDLLGAWRTLGILAEYARVADLGVKSGLNRQLPYLLGSGREDEAREATDAAFWTVLLASVLVGAGALAAALWMLWKGRLAGTPDPFALALAFFAPGLLLQQLVTFYQTLLRSVDRFAPLCRSLIVGAVVGTAACIVLAWDYGVAGMSIGFGIGQLASLALVLEGNLRRPRLRSVLRAFAPLARIGLPLFAAGVLMTVVRTVDQMLVGGLIGREALGYYACGFNVFLALSTAGTSMNLALLPELAREYGRSGDAVAPLERCHNGSEVISGLTGGLAGGAIIILGPLLHHWLSDYSAGELAMRWLCVMAITTGPISAYSAYLAALGRQMLLCAILGAAIALLWAVDLLAVRALGSAEAVACAHTLGLVVLSAALAVASGRVARRTGGAIASVSRAGLISAVLLAPGLGAALLLPVTGSLWADVLRALVGIAGASVVCVPIFLMYVVHRGVAVPAPGPVRPVVRAAERLYARVRGGRGGLPG